jgi:hypothetical protein
VRSKKGLRLFYVRCSKAGKQVSIVLAILKKRVVRASPAHHHCRYGSIRSRSI